ncbi:hypothetical protein CN571_15615 [Bacillus pseudomycoides]|uniref:hypothetical protein n=1 Tax=Bacillus pseudomycoides TaxID=64104 RepID=UPI000BF6E426|nr:hypothetical protein [Bacillus pseudomycoides]PEO88127.1 hypothetical protein CN571_15615 [Bacillus pseudomycoides]
MDFIYLILTTLVGSIFGNFCASFLKEKGKNLATKQDIEVITRKQEEVKKLFQLEMEQQKAELSKLSKEFELYAVKKHEYYPELYKVIATCIGKVTYLRGSRDGIDFRKYKAEEVTRYMEDNSFTATDKEYILSNWNENTIHLAIRQIENILIKTEYIEAKESYLAANNFYALHLLYFSDKVSFKVNNLLNHIWDLWIKYNPDLMILDNNMISEKLSLPNEEEEDEIDRLRKDLLKRLQYELNIVRTVE